MVPFVTLAIGSSVLAQSIPTLSHLNRQRLDRDLTMTNSQDFFRQGQAQLEREIRLLERRSRTQSDTLLKVDPATQPEIRQPLRFTQSDERSSSKGLH